MPKKFNFGDKVKITGLVAFRYPGPEEKASSFKDKRVSTDLDCEGIVLRKTRKATGYYNKGSTGRSGFDWDEPEPPSLEIKDWHPVYEVAVHPHGRLSFAEEDQLKLIEEY